MSRDLGFRAPVQCSAGRPVGRNGPLREAGDVALDSWNAPVGNWPLRNGQLIHSPCVYTLLVVDL